MKIHSRSQRAPSDWENYLSNSDNKQELHEFLFKEWSEDPQGKYAVILGPRVLFMNHGNVCHRLKVLNGRMNAIEVAALFSKAEQADTHMFLHAMHASNVMTSPSIVIRSSDTDVLVLSVYFQFEIDTPTIIQRQAKHKKWKYVNVNDIRRKIAFGVCKTLPGFHAFSGCDSTSSFSGKSKKILFKLLQTDRNFQESMVMLGEMLNVSEEVASKCEATVCSLYGYDCQDVNQV